MRPALLLLVAALVSESGHLAADDPATPDRLSADLASDDYNTRATATAELIARGIPARMRVSRLRVNTKDPEVRARTLTVLQGIDENEFLRLMAAFGSPSPGRPPAPSPAGQAGSEKAVALYKEEARKRNGSLAEALAAAPRQGPA